MGLKRYSRVVISLEAQESIRDIAAYVARRQSLAMAKWVRSALMEKCKSLKDFAGYSKEVYLSDTGKEYRSITQWDYNIIYRIDGDTIRILNVVHTSRHPDKRKDFLP
jgi:plasmid stabilization system protein ParE